MSKMFSNLTAAILVLVMLFALAACGTSSTTASAGAGDTTAAGTGETASAAATEAGTGSETAAEPAGQAASGTSDETLKVCLDEEPSCILPLSANAGIGTYIAQCLYDTLLRFDSGTGEIIPNLATDYEWVDDTHIRLTLRDDAIAYDGTTITASDVLYSVQRGLEGDAPTQWKYVNLDECSVEDDTHFVLGLTEKHPTMVNMLANIAMLDIIDESSVEANGGYDACLRNPLCNSGAYTFVEWKNGESITLERNENYWGDAPYYKTIVFTFLNDSASRAMSVSSGDVNFAVNLAGADVATVAAPNVLYPVSAGGSNVIFMNVNNEYLANETVREAIFYAIDVNAINQVGTAGTAALATSLIPSSNPYYVAPDESYDHTVDVEKAKELLTEAGYPDGFDLYMPIMAQQQAECEVIQACLLEIGINVDLEVVELPVYLAATDTGDLDLCLQRITPDDIINILNYFDDRLEPMARGGGIIGGDKNLYPYIDACRDAAADDMAPWGDFQNYVRDHYLFIPVYDAALFDVADGNYTFLYDQIGYINFSTCRPVV